MTIGEFRQALQSGCSTNIVMVGDSITLGTAHCCPEETYVAKFAYLLASHYKYASVVRYDGIEPYMGNGSLVGFSKEILVQSGSSSQIITVIRDGIGGNTSAKVLERLNDFTGTVCDCSPDLIMLMLGINDSIENDPQKYTSPEDFKTNMLNIINGIRTKNPDTAIVLITPSYNDDGKSEKSSLDSYSKKVIELAKEEDLPFINLHKFWMEHLVLGEKNNGQGDWLSETAGDMCHPSPIGSEKTAKFIYNELIRM